MGQVNKPRASTQNDYIQLCKLDIRNIYTVPHQFANMSLLSYIQGQLFEQLPVNYTLIKHMASDTHDYLVKIWLSSAQSFYTKSLKCLEIPLHDRCFLKRGIMKVIINNIFTHDIHIERDAIIISHMLTLGMLPYIIDHLIEKQMTNFPITIFAHMILSGEQFNAINSLYNLKLVTITYKDDTQQPEYITVIAHDHVNKYISMKPNALYLETVTVLPTSIVYIKNTHKFLVSNYELSNLEPIL